MKTIYALGYFDGVHLGHQALLSACRDLAEDCQSGALTFLEHPDALIYGKNPGLINTPEDRKTLLQQYGAEKVTQLPFDRAMMETSWQDFLMGLIKNHDAAGFVCGADFVFGNRGAGNALLLQQFCREKGLPCCLVAQQMMDGIRISSTHIRGLLEQGKLTEAAEFSGHPHILSGTVVKGKQLGRTIGVPTANLAYPKELVKLPHGVYACRVSFDGKSYKAVVNMGTRPTVSGRGVTVESWLMDFSGDLYGKRIQISFLEFIRPEQKFPDLPSLRAAIEKDRHKLDSL